MNHVFSEYPDDLLTAVQIRQRYGGVSDMTIKRWLANRKLKFPNPIRINGRRYWRRADLQAFEQRQTPQADVAPHLDGRA